MAAGTRRGVSQDRIIVHAPLDVFGVGGNPAGENLDRKSSKHASSASSRVAVRPGRDGAGVETGRRVGYAMRHIRKQSEEKLRQKQSPGVLSQASVGVVRTAPVHSGSVGKPLTKPDFKDQHESTKATNMRSGTRRLPLSADLKEQYPHPPPLWRPISSVTHTPPRRHRYSATPPERDREHERDREYERNPQKDRPYDEGRLDVGYDERDLQKDQHYDEGRLDVEHDERDLQKEQRYNEDRREENVGHDEGNLQKDQQYDERRTEVENGGYGEPYLQKSPHYLGGRPDVQNVEYIPAGHPESATDERYRGEGWAVRQQDDGKHGDANWAGQNGRYRSPNQRRYSPHTPRDSKGQEYEHQHAGPETFSARGECRDRYGEGYTSKRGGGDGGGGGDGNVGGSARYHGDRYAGGNDSHGSRQESFVRGRDRYGGGSDYDGSNQDRSARGRDRYGGGGNDSRGSRQDSFATGRDRYGGGSDSRGSKEDSFVTGRDRYGGGGGGDYYGSKQDNFVKGRDRYGGRGDSDYHGSKQDTFGRAQNRYPPPDRYIHDYRTAGDRSGMNEGGWKGRTTPTYRDGGVSDRDTRGGIHRVGYIGGEGNGGGIGGARTTFPELASCRRGHAQTQPLPSRRRPSPGIPTKIQSQDDKCIALQRRRSPRRAKRGDSIASPVPTGRRLWTAEDENKRPKPESLNEALVKSPSDMLLFSKKARQVDFKPRTLKEYRATKPTGYVELGKLQPDLHTDELVAKRANAERVKEFSVNLRQINSDTAARRVTSNNNNQRTPTSPALAQDARSKAIAFARRIPRPRKRPSAQPPVVTPPDSAEVSARRRADRRGDRLAEERWRQGGSTGGMEALDALQQDVDVRRKARTARRVL